MFAHAQIRLPVGATTQVKLLDLRGSTNSCVYELNVFSVVSNVDHEWCANNQPASVWQRQQTFYLHSSANGPAQVIDVVFNRTVALASGAVWIRIEGTHHSLHFHETTYCRLHTASILWYSDFAATDNENWMEWY